MKNVYDKDYFEKYSGTGYTLESTYLILRPFAVSIVNLMRFAKPFKSPVRALDIGCAKGYLVKMLRLEGIEAYGVDISEYAIQNSPSEIRQYLHRVDVETESLPFPEKFFDMIISIATFEHLQQKICLSLYQKYIGF